VPELEGRLAALVARAEATWPLPAQPRLAFVAHLAARIAEGDAPDLLLSTVHVEDLYLAFACARGDAAALARFDQDCMPSVDRVLARLGLAVDEIDDLKQALRQRLFVSPQDRPLIARYGGRGPLRQWLRVVAAQMAGRARARSGPEDREADVVDLVDAGDDPEASYLKARYEDAFRRAMHAALATMPDRDRSLLLHLRDGLGADEIASIYRVHRSTITRQLAKLRRALLHRARRALMRQESIGIAECDSILRLVKSRIGASVLSVSGSGGGDGRLPEPEPDPPRGAATPGVPDRLVLSAEWATDRGSACARDRGGPCTGRRRSVGSRRRSATGSGRARPG
jgi:RNA polymerase sigma-70 factor (ECF subfamily)